MTFSAVRHLALPPLALAMSTACAFAQSATEPALNAVLVTASRTPQAATDVIADHVTIDAAAIERSGASTIVDLLKQQRAIEITRNGGPGASASVFLRGAEAKQSVVLVDGVRVSSSTTGSANWSAIPLTNIERIEIVYGPLATMYGADAIGGVVQIFTRRGNGAPQVRALAGAGSRGARAGDLSLAGAGGAVHYAVSAARDEDDGFSATRAGLSSHNPDRDGYAKESASARIGIDLGPNSEIGALYLHSRLKAQYDAGASAFDARSVQSLDNGALYGRHRINRAWLVHAQVAQATDEAVTYANASATGTSSIRTRQHLYSLQSELQLGADLLQVIAERREEDVLSSSSAALTRSRATNSLAGAYTLKRGNHVASLSVRGDDSSQYGLKKTGGIGYGYRISPALRATVSAGTSFRAPTFNELYFSGFGVASNRPERGRNAEAGLFYRDGATAASLHYYRNRLTDLLVNLSRCPVEVATHPNGCAYNVNRATLEGVSATAEHRIGSFDLHASLDWQDPRDDTTGKRLPRRAQRHGSIGVDYATGPLMLGGSILFASRRFDDSANRNLLAGYGTVNLHGEWAFARNWSILARWDNAADKQYELARFYNTAGSTVFAGIRYGGR